MDERIHGGHPEPCEEKWERKGGEPGAAGGPKKSGQPKYLNSIRKGSWGKGSPAPGLEKRVRVWCAASIPCSR